MSGHFPHEFPGVLQRVAQRLLADDVNARVSGEQAVLAMQPRRGEDVDEIQSLLREHFLEARIHAGTRNKLLPALLRFRNGAVAQRDDLDLGNAQPPAEVELRDHSAAEKASAQLHRFIPNRS